MGPRFIDTILDEGNLPLEQDYKDLLARNVSKLERTDYEEFLVLRALLENEGFKYSGQKANDQKSYLEQLANEKNVPETHQKIRQKYCFKNCVEETIFQYLTQGNEIIITQGFDREGNLIDSTSFFIRKKDALSKDIQKQLKDAEESSQKNYDLYMKACEEMKSIAIRRKKEKEETVKYANESLIKELLPTIDNFYRAIEHSKEKKEEDNLVKGVELVLDGLLSTLKKAGVEEVESIGKPFDPNFHEAVSTQSDDKVAKGNVLIELQKGYILNGRLIRPSMVIVSTGIKDGPEEEK